LGEGGCGRNPATSLFYALFGVSAMFPTYHHNFMCNQSHLRFLVLVSEEK
jgi:hypothetical protein